ncbi:trehalose-phosphatase [Histoplasma capsulatum G186AR]|uniref:Trehalose-phosphatase n=2 Tax=Ajellomyces capsulatus TaxID=5037 RepID=C0NJ13_AJECG|nr:trehalose-phosphatase [Histoplasma capsulatum G186AR]EEH07854.1 trehalose-phosphatase [Histoplasma capsulatum G186AR]KAG5299810.1 trehalose-phosphatase [Histoplasma capsulatum]QSS67563.1 trehalose-phosphatase [Histoplasma capsulatum G186AR]
MASNDVGTPSGTASGNPESIAPEMSSKTTDADRFLRSVGNNDAELVVNIQHGTLPKFPGSPTEAAKGVKSGADLLRRLSLVRSSKPAAPSIEPQEGHPGLHLTGRIISAAFCIPYKLRIRPGRDWELKHRPGTSALFDSFSYLASSKTSWNHIMVGWTGEIEQIHTPESGHATSPGQSLPAGTVPTSLNKASAPVPIDPSEKPSYSFQDGICVTQQDRIHLEAQLRNSRFGRVLPIWLTDEQEYPDQNLYLKDQGRWRRYPERELYPVLHYKQRSSTDGWSERKWWADYVRLNKLFADRILETYTPGDIVWIHDYHLFLLPGIIRQMVPNIYIGFFLHAPFPSSEFMRCLSKRKDILTGVLGANMIGFQTFSYSRHFASCCTRILGFDSNYAGIDAYGAHVAVDVFPIGIDVDAVRKLAYEEPGIGEIVNSIRKQYHGKRIIIGRDRLDSVRGVTQKLMAFETFLERYPQWRNKVVLIQVTNPTSVEEEKEESEAKISSQMSHLVSTINGRFGSLSFSPVQHYSRYLVPQEYFALLRAADIGLITSVRDGMNTTSLEYVVCQHENHGPLILSEFSGTAGSLSSAIHINPWDLGGVADVINQALLMTPEEREAQHSQLYKYVTTHTITSWSDKYLKRLLTNLSSFDQSIATPALDKSRLLSQYRKSRGRLFMFDYDGTLTPIVKDPQAAIPSDRVLRTIKTLAADPKNSVWIISGRDQAFLDEWMGHISELGLSAEHGCFIRHPRNDDWENLTEKSNMGWQKEVLEIFQHYTERTQGSFIERKRVALTWHYRRADPEYGTFQATECRKHLENTVLKRWPVEVLSGKANLEVRPTFINKGSIATRLVEEYKHGLGQDPDFVLCLGDDFTDEDMFRALANSSLPRDRVFSVTVGASSKQTLANWHLLEPADVIATIALLNSKTSS